MRFNKNLALLTSAVCMLFAFGFWLFAGAAAQSGGAITIDPIYQDITIPDKSGKQYSVKLTNNTDRQQNFRLKTADFGSLNETGGVAFIGITKPDVNYKYGLSPWISLDQEFVALAAGQTRQVGFKITKIDSLTPGGHYGAVLITPDVGESGSDKSKVRVSPVVSSLIFLKKVGGERYGLELKSATNNHSLLGLPGKVSVRFLNIGNTHLVPRGTVALEDSRGRLVSDGLINPESGYILPETHRQFQTNLKSLRTAWWPGSYKLKINFRYDGNSKFITKSETFFYIGLAPKLAGAAFIILVAFWLTNRKAKPLRRLKRLARRQHHDGSS